MTTWILLLSFLVNDSSTVLIKEAEFPCSFKKVFIDNLDFIYGLNDKNNLLKLDHTGKTLYSFEDKSFPVYHANVSNPLRILLYNQQQNCLLFADKTLSPFTERIHLDRLQIPYTQSVSTSRDNNFWVFDNTQQSLNKYNQHSELISTTGNLISAIEKNIQPIELLEAGDKVYALDSILGVFQFDYLGTYLFNFKEIQASKIDVVGKNIVFLKDNQLYIYDTILMEKQKIILPENPKVLDFALGQKKLLILTEQKLLIYRSGLR